MSNVPRRLVALTFDYETWQPIPPGKHIDWDADVFIPAQKLIEGDVPVTLFAEMGEYFWLDQNDPPIARRMEEQWREAIRRGHDVQLHLHPAWLPECGATCVDGDWSWDTRYAKADDYPGDLDALIERCVSRLHDLLQPVDPEYRVTCFRAGAYQAQPFRRLSAALVRAGIECDSSVYAGGVSEERGYDYTFAYSNAQPYFASPWDPQLRGTPIETDLVELPIAVSGRHRLMLDGNQVNKLVARTHRAHAPKRDRERAAGIARAMYRASRPVRRPLGRILPAAWGRLLSSYGPEQTTVDEYTVAIGHTKGHLRADDVLRAARELRGQGHEVVTLAEMAELARGDLLARRRSVEDELAFQVDRERGAQLGDDHNEAQSAYLQRLIPLDRVRVLDLGCGAGHWSALIARTFPWMSVVGIDVGSDFIAAANARYASDRVSFAVADFTSLPFEDGSFDCIYADNTLEHAYDVDAALRDAHRVLRRNGVLVAAIPSDGRNPRYSCDNHTWKTLPGDVAARLEAAGFVDVSIDEVNVVKKLGAAPFAPSDDLMMYVRAWKRDEPADELTRAREAVAWLYQRLDPTSATSAKDAVEIIAGGVAFCAGYAFALKGLLDREGIAADVIQMRATDHPRGRGDQRTDTHEVVEARLDGQLTILDAMACTVIPHSLMEILEHPGLATGKPANDERYAERGYALYDTGFWYSRVTHFRAYRSAATPWRRNRHRSPID